jgi:hypothetical protein
MPLPPVNKTKKGSVAAWPPDAKQRAIVAQCHKKMSAES